MPKPSSKRVIVFDTETTGLLRHPHAPLELQPHIIEFAAVILADGEVVGEESFRINPQQELSAEITKITGITTADVSDQPTFLERLPRIVAAFSGCDLMIAHNLSFDRGMLTNDLKRHGVADFPWPLRGVCTVELWREFFGYRPNLKKLYGHVMGRPLQQKHRALDDVQRLVEVVQKEEIWKL